MEQACRGVRTSLPASWERQKVSWKAMMFLVVGFWWRTSGRGFEGGFFGLKQSNGWGGGVFWGVVSGLGSVFSAVAGGGWFVEFLVGVGGCGAVLLEESDFAAAVGSEKVRMCRTK